ncbi:MAG: DNA polymerase I, partial [Lachnospiraceae bacterium]|nr:DNA polymerase I [Lachnospiraceae bacterium]
SVTILSGDRDLLQIASDNIKISIPSTRGNKTETVSYKTAEVKEKYSVTPLEFIDVKALQGDTSDNIPGVRGIGEKTAQKLISEYHSLEGVYENLEAISGKALKQNLIDGKDSAFLSRTLATIETKAPIDFELDRAKIVGFLNQDSKEVLLKYSLKSIIERLEKLSFNASSVAAEVSLYKTEFSVVEDFNEATSLMESLKKADFAGIYLLKGEGVALSFAGKTCFLKFFGMFTEEYVRDFCLKDIGSCSLYTYRIKSTYPILPGFSENLEDIELLAYLLNPLKGDYPLTDISEYYGHRYRGSKKDLPEDSIEFACAAAEESVLLFDFFSDKVKELDLYKLYKEMEMPLSYVLYSMEKAGISVNKDELYNYGQNLVEGIRKLEAEIFNEAGEEFNINSPKQLGEILFGKLNLPGGKKTKSGFSTAADVLEKLSADYPIVDKILEFRTLSKLKSTYADGLSNFIGPDGKIHTNFNQTVTATGRISSSDPNLQNIPIRTELGRLLRKVFYPEPGYVFIDADYSQIELRLMAHMSSDEDLIRAFKEGKDIHRSTASRVFNKPYDEVTDMDRRRAKAVNFGIIYGISAFGLSKDVDMSVSEAKRYIEGYFATYPKVKEYLDNTVAIAKEKGFSKTLYGRIRPIPELKESNFMTRQFGERVAMNAPIQGTAADIMKIAMIKIHRALKEAGLSSRLLIQVHDEVLIETKLGEEEKVMEILKKEMEGAVELSVPLEIDIHKGDTWFDAK